MKKLFLVVAVFSLVCVFGGAPSITIDAEHFASLETPTPKLVYDGVSVSYVFDSVGKNSLELGGSLAFLSSASAAEYYKNDFFNSIIKVYTGQVYDFTSDSAVGLRVISRVGFVSANFSKFGFFYSITPVFYIRVGFLSFGISSGLELEQFFTDKPLPLFHAGGEITYRF